MAVELREQVWAKTDGHCWYCGKKMNPWNDFTIEHMDPSSRGGCNNLGNLVPACKGCNSRKHTKTVEEYRSYLHDKRMVRFWGEHSAKVPFATLVTVQEKQAEDEEEDVRRPYEDLEAICLYANDFDHPTVALTMIALLNLGYEYMLSTSTPRFYLSFDDIHVKTRLPKATLLAHILRLHDTGTLTLTRISLSSEYEYALDLALLESMEPWELWGGAGI